MRSIGSSRAIGAAIACLAFSLGVAVGLRAQSVTCRAEFDAANVEQPCNSLIQATEKHFTGFHWGS